jgi:hypothetical protein
VEARLDPKIEIREPGAIGGASKLAAFATPDTTGAVTPDAPVAR